MASPYFAILFSALLVILTLCFVSRSFFVLAVCNKYVSAKKARLPRLSSNSLRVSSKSVKKLGLKKAVAFIFLILLFLLLFQPWASAKLLSDPKAVILVFNGTDLKDIELASMPNIKALIRKGDLAIGLMNARSGKSAYAKTSGYLTIGSGAKANAGAYGSLGFNENEKFDYQQKKYFAGEFYKEATGFALKQGQVINLGIIDASRLGATYDYPLIPGLLGGLLKQAGIKRAVIGNADSIDGYHREASLIAMDTTGKIDHGNTGGIFSDVRLLSESKNYLNKARFVVVEYGPVSNLDYSRNFLSDKQAKILKVQALAKADKFVGQLLEELDLNKDMLIIVSPTPSQVAQKQKNLMAPIMIGRSGIGNIIYSQSTKWPGIVDNLDIAPTILDFFGTEQPVEMTGNALSAKAYEGDVIKQVLAEEEIAVANNIARVPLLTGYVVIIMSVIILAVLLLFLPAVKQGTYKVAQTLLVFLVCVPPVLLLFSLVHYANPWVPIAGVIIGSIALTALFLLIVRDRHKAFLFLFIGTVALVVIDVFTGSYLMKNSVLGFSPIVGARFYGIGNEFMGITVGATILSLSLFKDTYKVKSGKSIFVIMAIFIAITFVIGFPGLGTNVGGALAASTGFVFAVFYLSGRPFTWRQPVVLLICLAVALTIIFLSDSLLGANTHAAKTTELISKGGFAEILTIFKRKILANFKLVKYTAWTKVIITILIIMPILFMKPSGAVKRLREKLPNIWAGVIGVSFGAIGAFLFNDSGIVAAATCLLYAAVVVLYVIMDEQLEKA